ncbi:MAG: YceI family protein [Acidimicrobiales bacterium]|jgi:polyisoprenoid-binding protein YceI
MRFSIDPARSSIWIDARSSVHPIHAEIKEIDGYLVASIGEDNVVDVSKPVSGRIEVVVSRLSSGNPLYDREMQRRVDSRRYPTIAGELVSMAKGGADEGYVSQGDVTFHGATKRVADLLQVSMPDDRTVVLEGQHTFDIRDFGVEPPRILMLRVHPDVAVRLRMVATAEGPVGPDRPEN